MAHAVLHLVFDEAHPLLHVFVVGVDYVHKGNALLFRGEHGVDPLPVVEFNLIYVLKHLFQVGLHGCGLLSLREDFEQVVVGQEVESRELLPLLLQLVV